MAMQAEEWNAIEEKADVISGRLVGGSIKDGKEIMIGIPTEDGNRWFKFPHGMMVGIIHTLRTFGELANKARSNAPVRNLETITDPYRVRGQPRFGNSPDGSLIAIQFLTEEGIPVSVALPRAAASTFADALKAHIAKVAKKA